MHPRPRPRKTRELESIMRHEHLVTLALRLDHSDTTLDVAADAFLRNADVLRRGDVYEVRFGEHATVRMPRAVAREMVVDLLHLLEWEDGIAVLRSMEERMR